MTMLKYTVRSIDAAPQSRGDAENRRFLVLDHAGRGDPGDHKTANIDCQPIDNLYTAEEAKMLLHGREKVALLPDVHAEELHSGVRGEFYAGNLRLRAILHAK